MSEKKSKPTQIDKLEQGDWLYDLLGEARKSVAEQPSAAAIKRIEAKVFAEMEERGAEKAAA